ncbi:hypothetical protein EDB92DRAFT_1943659 [Lactarius akahatsu]|uniref:Uncharacterized protein n=1 Tax=Lactarius akahatsu TaxID=416441 RepID=A0AAD4LNT8_9AGAM|nr:hypothetical protein EDB92DRAFT_1943659 [Lactarius akahatsu]
MSPQRGASTSLLYVCSTSRPETGDDHKVRTLKHLVDDLRTRRPHSPSSITRSSKRLEKQLEDFDEAEYRQLESLRELFEFLDDIVPQRHDGRYERCRTSQSDEHDKEVLPPSDVPTRIIPRRAATKKVDMTPIRLEGDDDEDEKNDVDEPTPVPRSKRRVAACVSLLAAYFLEL